MPDLGLSPHMALVLWAQLALLLAFAHGFGAVARRLGQPAIIGALVAGLVLGPSVFGVAWPGGESWLLPAHSEPLGAISQACLLVLLVALGAETDLGLLRRLGRPAVLVTAFSIAVPLAVGLGAGELSPGVLLGDKAGRVSFALVLAGALSVSSLPVVARTISELGMVRRNFGQLSVAAATVNDVYGFLVLAVIGPGRL
jgi:Kef-type K+ transport system membrane component KefB